MCRPIYIKKDMDLGGFQNKVPNTERMCTSAPLNMDVGQTTPDVSVVVHGELPSMRGLNTQPPTFPADTSILDSDGASGFFNPAVSAHEQLSSANHSMNLAEQSRLPVQCTSSNRSLDTLIRQAQRPAAQSCIETMLTPGSADQVLSRKGQLLFLTSADPASSSNSQNRVGFCHGEKQGHPGLLQQRNFSHLDNPMVSFPGCYHSKQSKYSVPNSQEMAEQGFTYLGDGIFKCNTCNVKLFTKQSPIPSDILKNHHQLCQRQYDTRQYEMHFHSPQEQMLPETPEHAGEPDQVTCFSCGVGFRKWEPDDDPCKEHAHQSPNCTFVKQVLHSRSVQQPINGSSRANQSRTLATTGTSTSFQPRNLATNGSIYNWQHELPIDSITHDVSNISLDGILSMSREIDYDAIAEMGYQPDQIRRAITKLENKKNTGVIDTNSIVNEILEMDETNAASVCYLCQQDFRNGYTLCPCGHLAVCMKCNVYTVALCPVCGEKVERYVKTYPECQTMKP